MVFCGIKVNKNSLFEIEMILFFLNVNFSGIPVGCVSAIHIRSDYRQSKVVR